MRIHSKKGQTIVESVIAISILVVGLMGILGLLSQSLALNTTTKDQLQATYLAAEGIELAKNLIDHDVYAALAQPPQGGGWGSCFSVPLGTHKSFLLDYTTVNCPPPGYSATPLKFDPATGLYGYQGSVATPFERQVIVYTIDTNTTEVESVVTWSVAGVASRIDLQDYFYNWHP